LNAFREKDKSDLRYMIDNQVVQLGLLDQLFMEWNGHWFHHNIEIAANYSLLRGSYGSDKDL
jgi:hypothetical protein